MREYFTALQSHLEQQIIGQSALLERLLITALTGGHILVEGPPGLAKTTAVRTLAHSMALHFQRIQFTPDMIPGDITGSDIFIPQEGHFQFIKGPIFHEIILADEINRAPPKVQSALLEAMEERQVTVGGTTRKLPPVFMVMATQNPIEQEGTYPLPEAQLDRFLMKFKLTYPTEDHELTILQQHNQQLREPATSKIEASLTPDQLLEVRNKINAIYIDEMLERYIVTLVNATRTPEQWDDEVSAWIERGASPRATLALAHASRARAYLHGRDFVEPADIIDLAYDILNHRITLSFAARTENITCKQAIKRLVEKVPVP
ncbi:MAG TPA: MoxR family ATPase [Gammaproteobacteria bacterium]|nr:MoxR family ATPase [Gammaproteobacteria bacterium]